MRTTGLAPRLAALCLAALLLSPAARADDCAGAADQASLNRCADAAFRSADAALNAAYARLMAAVSADGQAGLRRAQRAWIVWRDAQCAFEAAGSAGGSIHPVVLARCRADLTAAQTARLTAQGTCAEGDLSCGGQ
ncbi:MAG: lysozyme inhibitor LprI family protein [Gemmobacter sp.]